MKIGLGAVGCHLSASCGTHVNQRCTHRPRPPLLCVPDTLFPNSFRTAFRPATPEGEPTGAESDAARAASEATKGAKTLQPIHLEVSRASAGAIEAVEAQGGTVTCAHFNRLALRALVRVFVVIVFS